MTHRTQITLNDDQYRMLQAISDETGLSMSELVRRALDRAYVARDLAAIEQSFGVWKDRDFDGFTYVERLRRGLGSRLEDRDGRAG